MKQLKKVGAALTVCALLLALAGCAPSLRGSIVKGADTYALDIEAMNGKDVHTMEFKQGDVLQIQFKTMTGSLSMEIKAPDGDLLYEGDGKAVTEFTLNVPADGAYTLTVEGSKAQGSIRVDVKKD